MADGEGLHSFYPVDVRLGVNGTEPGAGLVAKGESPGHRGPSWLMCGGTENVVEKKGTDSTVHMTGGPLVGRAEGHIGPDSPVGVVVDHQWGCQSVAQPDDGISPREGLPVDGLLDAE